MKREIEEYKSKYDALRETLDKLIIANQELAFQNAEKEKRAAELLIANKELAFQNSEKEKRAAELLIANKELAFQNSEKEKRAAELLVAKQELALKNKETGALAVELDNLAFFDPLTSLPNRHLLIDRLQHAFVTSARNGREGAVLLINLDNFKDVNDTLGREARDLLLRQVAQRLESCVSAGDTVAHLDGGEFVMILEDLSRQAIAASTQTKAAGEKVLAALNQPYQLGTHEHHGTASIGATLFSDHGKTAEELLTRATIAMQQARKAGPNTLRFFSQQMQDVIFARTALESELHKALEKQQFHLYYQIQVDSSQRLVGAEALVRWLHPERGLIAPAEFIPLAEDTGLILPIGLWVLETAGAQIKAWQQDTLTRDLILAVNVSARQFHQPDFMEQVQALVLRHAIDPGALKLEITESMLLDNVEQTVKIMTALKAIGVRFSLDDFGTGYSSLQYLKRLPFDQIKIDKTFVRNIAIEISDKAIVRAIIAMARSLELEVIAEGVETEAQRELLLALGCTSYQGYLFGRPVPIEQFEALLKQDVAGVVAASDKTAPGADTLPPQA